jgi:hypothetical protein
MRKKIYQFRKLISLFFLVLALRINSHNICAFIIWLNIRKLEKIKYRHGNVKKILFFSKSGGSEDLIEAFNSTKNNNIVFFSLPRSFLKIIFIYFFKKRPISDHLTKPINSNEINKKNLYVKFLTSTFNSINKFLRIDGFISFNVFYYAEKHFDEVCRNLNKKYIILHKESALTPLEEQYYPHGYRKYNDKSLSHKISVYSESQKKILIKSGIGTKKQVIVNGCPRSDYSFKLRKIKPKEKIIVFYLIETKRYTSDGFQRLVIKSNFSWEKLHNQTLEYLIEYAKNNPDVTVILKKKVGAHTKKNIDAKSLPDNCTFVDGGTGEKLLKDAKVVIAFNSTIVFEAIASNRNLIIPNFNYENKRRKKLMHEIKNKKHFASSKLQFNNKLNFYLNSKYKDKKLSNTDEKTLKYYLGNVDGKSGERMGQFLIKTVN